MKIKIKKFLFIFIFIFCFIILISCGEKSNISTDNKIKSTTNIIPTQIIDDDQIEEPWKSGKTIEGNKIEYDLKDEEINELINNLDLAMQLSIDDDESRYDEFVSIYNIAKNMRERIIDAYIKELLLFYIYGNESNLYKIEELDAYESKISSWINTIEHLIYENGGIYKSKLFINMNDDDIKKYIGIKYPEEYYQMENELEYLKIMYGTYDIFSATFYEDIDKLFVQYVNLGNEFVNKYHNEYNNYFEYLYAEVYHRDYKPEDTIGFLDNVINYVLPIYETYNNNYHYYYDLLNDSEKELVDTIIGGDAFTKRFDLIENYKEFIGDGFKEAFDNLFTEGGNYYISYEIDGSNSAHMWNLGYGTDKIYPYVFYGVGCHNHLNIIHELGHYFNGIINVDDNSSIDLSETHSQGNELLFIQYLSQYEFENENIGRALNNYLTFDYAEYLLFIGLTNEVERLCYEKDNLEVGDLKNIFDNVYNQYIAFEHFGSPANILYEFVQRSVIESPGYYISYATSQLGALNINKIAYDDFDKALETYYKLIYRNGIKGYIDVYEYAGLLNPFMESTFEYIFGPKT